jgi:hypothetical protein
MEPSDLAGLLPPGDLDTVLEDRADGFVDALLAQPAFEERVHAAAAQAREELVGYLRQEGLLDPEPYAYVELGWHGRAARSLQLVLRNAGHGGAARYQYFGLYAPSGGDGPPEHAEAFLRDFRDAELDMSRPDVFFLEACAAGLEGRTVRVERRGDRYEPVLSSPRNDAAIEWGLEEIYAGVERFAEHLADGLAAVPAVVTKPNVVALRPAAASVLETVWSAPTPAEASVLGRFPLRRSMSGGASETIARPLRWKDAARALTPRGRRLRGWTEGSASLSSAPLRRLNVATWRLRELVGRVRRRGRD